MPGWLWDTVNQYPLAEGDTRTQYADGSTFVGPLKDGMRHGKGAYFFQDGSRCVPVSPMCLVGCHAHILVLINCYPCWVDCPRTAALRYIAVVALRCDVTYLTRSKASLSYGFHQAQTT